MDKVLQVKKERELPSHLKHLPIPPIPGEKVIVLEVVEQQYLKVRYNKSKTIGVFSKHYFEPVNKVKLKS